MQPCAAICSPPHSPCVPSALRILRTLAARALCTAVCPPRPHPPPPPLPQSHWLPTVVTSDELCTLVMMVTRSYLVARTLRYLSGIESRQTRGYSNMNNLNITTTMSLRMLYNRFPIALMASLTGYLLPVFAFGMQMAERKANHNLDSFANTLWLALTSVTSLGFGDFVPLSPLGRAIDAVAIGWGLLLYATSIEIFL